MIQDYESKRNIQTQGDTATLFFGIKADNVPLKDAIDAESEFTRFLSRVTGKQITTTAKPSETRTIIWITDETETVKAAASVEEAWQAYRRKFPTSLRSHSAVKNKWLELHKTPAPADKPTDGLQGGAPTSTKKPEVATVPEKPPVQKKKSKKESNAKNAKVPTWTDEQKALVKGCKTKEEAWEKFKEKYPGQRNENAVSQRFNILVKKKGETTSKQLREAIPPNNDAKVPAAAATAPPSGQSSDNVITPPPADNIIGVGDSVKQVSGMKICTGTGKVKRAPQGRQEVLVEFSNGQEWISRNKLQKVAA